MAKKRSKGLIIPNFSTLEEVAEAVRQIGDEQRKIDSVQLRAAARVETIKAEAMTQISDHSETIDQLVSGITAFATKKREQLTEGGKHKTVSLPTGSLSWRITPPKVNIQNIEKALQALERRGLTEFVRQVKEVNKEAILKEPDKIKGIKGISISQREEFAVKPAETNMEVVSVAKKLKRPA